MVNRYLAVLAVLLLVQVAPSRAQDQSFAAFTAELWKDALRRAGFDDVELFPDVVEIRDSYPGFVAAAACGRRPRR